MKTKLLLLIGLLVLSLPQSGFAEKKGMRTDGGGTYIDDGTGGGNLDADDFVYQTFNGIDDYIDSEFSEGTRYELKKDEASDILMWARNLRTRLIDLLKVAQTMRKIEQEDYLLNGIKSILREAKKKYNELFIRYVLSRALVIHKMLSIEGSPQDYFSINSRVAILADSIHLAIDRFYERDLHRLQNPKELYKKKEFAGFGISYNQFLEGFRRSVLDASAQYLIARYEIGLLHVDLARDLDKYSYARPIDIIRTQVSPLPKKAPQNDTLSITYIRQINAIKDQLDLREISDVQDQQPAPYFDRFGSSDREGHRDHHRPTRHDRPRDLNQGDRALYKKMLGHSSSSARKKAVYHLNNIPGDEVTAALIDALDDSNSEVAQAAYNVLDDRSIRAYHVQQLSGIYRESLSKEKRKYILWIIRMNDSDTATMALIKGMGSGSEEVMKSAYNTLDDRVLTDDHIRALGKHLEKANKINRMYVAYLLRDTSSSLAYQILGERFNHESNDDVIDAITNAMSYIRQNMKQSGRY